MLQLRVTKRQEPLGGWGSCFVLITALLISFVLSASLLYLRGTPPLQGLFAMFTGGFGSVWALQDTVAKAIPIFLCSLGVAVAFRLQIWNIGAEGQFALGAIGATWIAISFPDLPAYLMIPSMIIMAMIAGGIWGIIPAILRQKMKTNEIIVTLMMNYIAILLLQYLVYGAWKDPSSFGFPMTAEFGENAIVGFIGDTTINWGITHCFALGILIWGFLKYTKTGFELQAAGDSVAAVKYAGIRYDYLVILVMAISGALAGWAGFLESSATINRLQPSIMVGYGYTAIVVAWLARLHPLTIAISSFLLAGLRVGVENLQLDYQVPAAFGGIIEGLVLVTVLAGGLFFHYKIIRRK